MLNRIVPLWLALLVSAAAEPWIVEKTSPHTAPTGLSFNSVEVRSGSKTARLHVVTASARTHAFALMDDPENTFDLASAARKRGALAAVNGGYFHPDRTPLGLRVRQGREIHRFERAKLLSGLIVVTAERSALVRTSEFKPNSALREAIQAGPFLVDRGKPVAGLNATRLDPRTVVFTDGTRIGFASTSPLSLAQLGAVLATPGAVPGAKITRALNLDGGSSTGLWVASQPPFYRRELRDVRDFIGIVPR